MRDGVPMWYFPIGAKGDVHVPLRVVEDIEGGAMTELFIAAPAGVRGSVVVDLGMVEHCLPSQGRPPRGWNHRSACHVPTPPGLV
jgi:hypothetical protein